MSGDEFRFILVSPLDKRHKFRSHDLQHPDRKEACKMIIICFLPSHISSYCAEETVPKKEHKDRSAIYGF